MIINGYKYLYLVIAYICELPAILPKMPKNEH